MDFLDISLIFSILLCTLVTGFILTYAIIIMPGLSNLDDDNFIRAFQVTDGIIQNNQPLFILIWLGSIISIIVTTLISIISVGLLQSLLIICVSSVYLLGVQYITILVHLPLNKRIQKINIHKMSPQMLREERLKFESKWNYFNNIRTVIAFSISLILILIIGIR